MIAADLVGRRHPPLAVLLRLTDGERRMVCRSTKTEGKSAAQESLLGTCL